MALAGKTVFAMLPSFLEAAGSDPAMDGSGKNEFKIVARSFEKEGLLMMTDIRLAFTPDTDLLVDEIIAFA